MRDLPEKQLSVDVKHDFKPRYEVIKGKKLVEELKKARERATMSLLATDPDREGEAIPGILPICSGWIRRTIFV